MYIKSRSSTCGVTSLPVYIHCPTLLDKHRLACLAMAVPRAIGLRSCSDGGLVSPVARLAHIHHFVILSPIRSICSHGSDRHYSPCGLVSRTARVGRS